MTQLRGNHDLENSLVHLYRVEVDAAAADLLSAPIARRRPWTGNGMRTVVRAVSTVSIAAALLLALRLGPEAVPGVGSATQPTYTAQTTTPVDADSTPVTPKSSFLIGTPIEVAGLPQEVNCDARLRAELDAAVAIRARLRVDGLATGRDKAIEAAADPTTTLQEVGIPITGADRTALLNTGLELSADLPMTEWVYHGAPDRFGGMWRDPSNPSAWIVSIVDANRETLGLTRCISSLTDLSVFYVVATTSNRDGEALKDRISSDLERLRDGEKIPVTMLDFNEVVDAVVIGVDKPTQAMIDRLHELYGPDVRIVDEPPGVLT
jgi:hypothetical protein